MDSIGVSEAPDLGSIPNVATLYKSIHIEIQLNKLNPIAVVLYSQ